MTKSEIRKEIKNRAASFTKYKESSEKLCNKIIQSETFKTAEIILAYMALPDEADLSTVISKALELGKKVYIPKVFPESTTIEFYRALPQSKTSKGSYGIEEPEVSSQSECFEPEKLSPEENNRSLILVPGRAFTQDGRRLGRGKGYYDKYLARIKKGAVLAGVCLQFQLLSDLPADAHDIRMDFIFQE